MDAKTILKPKFVYLRFLDSIVLKRDDIIMELY